MIGFAACLGHSQWQRVRNNTSTWTVLAKTYIDTAWIARKDIITCFEATWSEGQLEMEEIAFYHYEVSENPVGDTSPRSNGVSRAYSTAVGRRLARSRLLEIRPFERIAALHLTTLHRTAVKHTTPLCWIQLTPGCPLRAAKLVSPILEPFRRIPTPAFSRATGVQASEATMGQCVLGQCWGNAALVPTALITTCASCHDCATRCLDSCLSVCCARSVACRYHDNHSLTLAVCALRVLYSRLPPLSPHWTWMWSCQPAPT